jgi:hypothetical protein
VGIGHGVSRGEARGSLGGEGPRDGGAE